MVHYSQYKPIYYYVSGGYAKEDKVQAMEMWEVKHSYNLDDPDADTPDFYQYQTDLTLNSWHTYPGVWKL